MAKKRSYIKDYGFKLILLFEKLIARASILGNPTFFDAADFPWVNDVEADWKAIRKEVDSLLEHRDRIPNFQEISEDQRAITTDDKWKTFFFYGYGIRMDSNCTRCPETTRLIETIPGMKTAMFSILSPGKHIPPHRGPYKGLIRYHLGLVVPGPEDSCRIRVGDDIKTWSEGGSLLFDDTYEHEVWNDSDAIRVVLFVDVLRPLAGATAALNRVILWLISLTPFIRDAQKNQNEWDRRLRERLDKTP